MQDIQQDENAHCTCVSDKDFFIYSVPGLHVKSK